MTGIVKRGGAATLTAASLKSTHSHSFLRLAQCNHRDTCGHWTTMMRPILLRNFTTFKKKEKKKTHSEFKANSQVCSSLIDHWRLLLEGERQFPSSCGMPIFRRNVELSPVKASHVWAIQSIFTVQMPVGGSLYAFLWFQPAGLVKVCFILTLQEPLLPKDVDWNSAPRCYC